MPRAARIASEPARRAVLAAVMVVLLGGTTALAVLMTRARTPVFDPSQPTHQFGPMGLTIPSNLKQQRANRATDPVGRTFVDENQLLRLKLALLEDVRIRPPIDAFAQGKKLLAPTVGNSDVMVHQAGPLTVILSPGYSLVRTQDGRTVPQKHVVAVATIDGATYLAAELMAGIGKIRGTDINTLLRIMMSIRDERFADAEPADRSIAGLRFPADTELVPLARRDGVADSQLIYVPTGARYFYRLPITVLEVDELWRQLDEVYEGPPIEDPMKRAAAAARLVLQITYARVHQGNPPADAFAEQRIADRPVARLLVVGGGAANGHHERWAMLIDSRRIVMVDVLADRRAIRQARAAARWVLTNLKETGSEADAE